MSESGDFQEIKPLETFAVIGFDGSTINGLKCHPDSIHIVYPMGNNVCIQEWETKKIYFLSGHTNTISTIALSAKGKYVGSGQINHIGFKAPVILWDFNSKKSLTTHDLHKVRVEAVVFSCDEKLMISLGGRDCGQIIVWDIHSNNAHWTLTASKVITGDAVTVAAFLRRCNSFMTAGDGTLRVWNLDLVSKGYSVVDISMGKLKRYIACVTIHEEDGYAYCGTTSGDIIKVTLGYPPDPEQVPSQRPAMVGCYAKCGVWRKGAARPETLPYSAGALCIYILDEEHIVVGGGDGTVDLLEEIKRKKPLPKTKLCNPVSPDFMALKSKKLNGAITSIQFMNILTNNKKKENIILMFGTKKSEIYAINMSTFQTTLIVTCHSCGVNGIAFPIGMSDVFATAGFGSIRVWALKTSQELLRIQVANFKCTAVLFSADGKSIVSGWNDGCIRAFTPLTGRLMYCILNAHNKGTSALALTADGRTMISGGCEGQVRVWSIDPRIQTLKAVLKEHKCPVSQIKINNINTEAVSAGTDGSCIIWDIVNLCRRQIMFANTVFMCVCYEPTGCQILTGGTDRRVAYWEVGTGNLAREIEVSRNDAVNTLDINHTGELFVTGGNDQMVKLWKYQEGIYTHVGSGHSGAVSSVSFTPDGRYIVSASTSGSIFVWKCPEEHLQPKISSKKSSVKSAKEHEVLPLQQQQREHLGPSKDENISTMDTSRSSVISQCPCSCASNSKHGSSNTSKGDNASASGSCHSSCSSKKSSKPASLQEMCKPPVSVKDD